MSKPVSINVEESDRNARAYGWEIGRGHPLVQELMTTPDNPFMNIHWRNDVTEDSEVKLANIKIQGVWLRRIGDEVQVLVEVNRQWRKVIVELIDDNFSHITEPNGIISSPAEPKED